MRYLLWVVHIKSHIRVIFVVMFLILFAAAPARAQLIDFSKYTTVESHLKEATENRTVVMVEGARISALEKAYLSYAKNQYPNIASYPITSDEVPLFVNASNTTVIIIGGPTQNSLAQDVLSRCDLNTENISLDIGRATFLTSITGAATNYVILSDFSGYADLPNTAPAKSPLARIIPEVWVPVAAAAIAISLLWLFNLLMDIGQRTGKGRFTKYIMDHVKKKEYHEASAGFKIFGLHIKYREWMAIFFSAVIFALAISYMYLIEQGDIIMFIIINIIINVILQLIKHSIRLVLNHHYHVKSEYTLWYWGAFITLVSGWLGNTFSLAGYMIKKEDDETVNAKRPDGKNEFLTAVFMGIVTLIVFGLNSSVHSHILQMVWVLCLTTLFIDLLPMKPFSGEAIRAWRKSAWWWLFIPVALIYIVKILIA